jgi:hypothetical protein
MMHYDEEKLCSYIDKKLDSNAYNRIKQHLSECDTCYMRYVSLKSGYLELENAKLSSVPQELIDKTNIAIGIKDQKLDLDKNLFTNLKKFFELRKNNSDDIHFFSFQSVLKPALSVAAIALLIFGTIFILDKDESTTIAKSFYLGSDKEEPKEGLFKIDSEQDHIPVMFKEDSSINYKTDYIRVPDLTELTKFQIIDTLKILNIKYKINIGDSFHQSYEARSIVSSKDTLFITLPAKYK